MKKDGSSRWDAEVDAAWTAFRQRLADRLAELGDDELVLVEVAELQEDAARLGAAPYVQFMGWGDGLVRAEAASNRYLRVDHCLEQEGYEAMLTLGWEAPTYFEDQEPDHGSDNFWVDLEVREADRAAWMAVAALRDVYGCLHPSFLASERPAGDDDEESVEMVEQVADAEACKWPPVVVFPRDHAHLMEEVVATVGHWLESDDVRIDGDGDIPIQFGSAVLFVRALKGKPAIDVFAEVVIDPEDAERLAVELDILNREHPLAKFFRAGERVVMVHRVVAAPFVPDQLRTVLEVLSSDVEEMADNLVRRVGGRRFLDPPPEPVDEHPGLSGLLELMTDGRVASSTVAELFQRSSRQIIKAMAAVRSGRRECGDHDLEDVMGHLRRALDLEARRSARKPRGRAASGPQQNLSLLEPDAVTRTRRPRPRRDRSA